ncbi:hypothetical protein EDB87DRAFT_1581928 [Lactarius vividus]|nr:hypothetical protein EDB87DRAFT_1581928 [Lactarius vividus]
MHVSPSDRDFSSGALVPHSRAARWYIGRWREMSLQPGPHGQTRQMHDLFPRALVSTVGLRSDRYCWDMHRDVRSWDMIIASTAFVSHIDPHLPELDKVIPTGSCDQWGTEITGDLELRPEGPGSFQALRARWPDGGTNNDNHSDDPKSTLRVVNSTRSQRSSAHAGNMLPVSQLQHKIYMHKVSRTLGTLRADPFSLLQYTFINIGGNHALVNKAFN